MAIFNERLTISLLESLINTDTKKLNDCIGILKSVIRKYKFISSISSFGNKKRANEYLYYVGKLDISAKNPSSVFFNDKNKDPNSAARKNRKKNLLPENFNEFMKKFDKDLDDIHEETNKIISSKYGKHTFFFYEEHDDEKILSIYMGDKGEDW